MIGRVVKIFSDFYYVKTEKGLVEAKKRTVLKKQQEDVFTGDFVELTQFDENSMQAFILKVINRKNLINKPKAANISQVLIVSALKNPELNLEQLNRYIAHCEFYNVKPILCFNKEDINDDKSLIEEIENLYGSIGYEVIFTSAITKSGTQELKPFLKGHTTILCGSSGVGKSSLINAILNNSKLRTLPVSEKNKKGIHTTRHCELIEIDENTFIVDTPGFSYLKFDFLLPNEIPKLFVEFKKENFTCKFKNCLHLDETGCGAGNIKNGMSKSRFESYKKFISEAKKYEDEISKKSIKKEENKKFNQNKIMTKISHKKRNLSRKTTKQQNYGNEI